MLTMVAKGYSSGLGPSLCGHFFRSGVETTAYIQPAAWIIELGELPDNAAIDEVIAAIRRGCGRAGSECYAI